MKKVFYNPREDWVRKCEDLNFLFHSVDNKYWVEEYAIELTSENAKKLEDAGNEIHSMCLDLISDVIKVGDYERYKLPSIIWEDIEKSWLNKEFDLYGRFDFSYDGTGFPKLLEYNADTPTSLIESSIVQKQWQEEKLTQYKQFNKIEEMLIKRWQEWKRNDKATNTLHLSCDIRSNEDWCNVEFLKETALKAGIDAKFINLTEIGIDLDNNEFVDLEDKTIETLFKLYPWEYIINEPYYDLIGKSKINLIEPMWKMLLSTKALLPLLWEKYPNHPNLLPAFFTLEEMKKVNTKYVQKPLFSREGSNIIVYDGENIIDSQKGIYGGEGYVYQERKDLASFDGRYILLGMWIVGGKSAGIGIREDHSLITKDTSWFLPHYIKD